MKRLRAMGRCIKRASYLARATAWAVLLGLIETVTTKRGRRLLAFVTLVGAVVAVVWAKPLRTVRPGELGIRVNNMSGAVDEHRDGWVLIVPGIHELRRYSLRDQIYRPGDSARAAGKRPYQSVEGLSIGVDVVVRYALDPKRIETIALGLPSQVSQQLIEPVIDGVLHRTFSRHTVREIFSTKRAVIEQALEKELARLLAADGVQVRDIHLGHVDLPKEYRVGLEALLAEGLRADKMRFTLARKQKEVEQSRLEAQAAKVRREKEAEAAGQERIIAARARAEAMKHVLPLKKREIEQKRLEAEAARVSRVKLAHANADARRVEAAGEADGRRKLAEAEAYRLEVTGKARSEQLARDGVLIAKNPLLIQKTLADKLSDKIKVIIAPPRHDGFIAGGLLGINGEQARAEAPR